MATSFFVERYLAFKNTRHNRWEPLKSYPTHEEAVSAALSLKNAAQRHGSGKSKNGGTVTDYRVTALGVRS